MLRNIGENLLNAQSYEHGQNPVEDNYKNDQRCVFFAHREEIADLMIHVT